MTPAESDREPYVPSDPTKREYSKAVWAAVAAHAAKPDDWAARIRARIAVEETRRDGLLGALDRAADGPRKIEAAIAGALGIGLTLVWLGWLLGRR